MALSLHESSLRCDVFDATGATKVGIAPAVLAFKRIRSLNQIGTAEITLSTPAISDTGLITAGRRYRIYNQQYGLLGSFVHRSYNVSGDRAVTTIQADDLLRLFARRTTKLNRRYGDNSFGSGSSITTVVQAVTDLATSMNSDPSYVAPETWGVRVYDPTNSLASQAISVEFQGQTMFEAVDALRKLTRTEFRLDDSVPSAPVLEFGDFFTGDLSLYGTARYGYDLYFGSITGNNNIYATNTEVLSRSSETTRKRVVAITVIYGGDHYATAPTVVIAPPTTPGGTTATATAIINGGKVVEVMINNPGSGYTFAPVVTFSGGTPTPAAPGDILLESSSYLLKEDSGKFLLEGTGFNTIVPARAFSFVGSDMILVTDCQITQETDKVVNRAIVLGAGDGLNQFTMQRTYDGYVSHTPPGSSYSYAVQRGLNPDGQTYYYYLEDAASIASYGLFEDVVAQNSIRPLTNSDTSQRLASDALYYIGAAYLTANKSPAIVYAISVRNMPSSAKPGDVIFFRYVGQASFTDDTGTTSYRYIDVASAAVIMDITETFSANGDIDVQLVISTNGERGVSETDVIIGTQQSVNALKVAVQPYPCRDTITARQDLAPNVPMEFIVPVENEVLNILKATITLVTKPFRSVLSPTAQTTITIAGSKTNYDAQNDDMSNNVNYVVNQSLVPHAHSFPIYGGIEYAGALTDAWFVTFGPEGNMHVGSLSHGNPPWGGNSLYFGDGAGYGVTYNTQHQHSGVLVPHRHGIPGGTANISLPFGIFDDDQLPTGVSLYVNGALVTTLANPGAAPITLDISNNVSKSVSNLVHIECSGGRGQIEASVRLFLSVQATVPTL